MKEFEIDSNGYMHLYDDGDHKIIESWEIKELAKDPETAALIIAELCDNVQSIIRNLH